MPGDKSISHRLALFGAVAFGDTKIRNFSEAADCQSTLGCLQDLGVAVTREPGLVTLRGRGFEALRPPAGPLDAGNSGSTLRMLSGILAGRPFKATLTGDESLRRRPVERVAAPLRAMGAKLSATEGRPPLTIEGGPLEGIDWQLEVASAQAKTAVLLAGLQARGRTSVSEPHQSRDHTERLLPAFGVALQRDGNRIAVDGGARLHAAELTVPGDASSAAFLVVAAVLLPDSEVRVEGVSLNPGRTAFLDVLREMGADVEVVVTQREPEPVGTIVARSSSLRGVAIAPERVAALIDEIPALAVAGAVASGSFSVSGARELRVKESDRIATLAEGLRRMGASLEEHDDGFTLSGGARLRGARVRSHGDHRIAMALAVAGLAAAGETEIEGAECVGVSFPGFFEVLAAATREGPEAGARDEPRRIVLVGFMGSGKSSVGAELAALLGWSFVDLDGLIVERTGRSIAQIFEGSGEPAFRAEERQAAQASVTGERRVIAAGGGAFADPETREILRAGSATVYLECDLPTVFARVPSDGSRPLSGNRETMRRLFLAREAAYRSADVSVDASRGTPPELARKIARLLNVPLPGVEPLA